MTPIITTMEVMPPDSAPVQAVALMNATMEAMPSAMALGGRLTQQQHLYGHPVPRRRPRKAAFPCPRSDGHGYAIAYVGQAQSKVDFTAARGLKSEWSE